MEGERGLSPSEIWHSTKRHASFGSAPHSACANPSIHVATRAKVAELWKEPFRVWFPGGREDPDIALIAVEPERAEYWDNSGFHKLQYLWEAAGAYVTGDTPKVEEGEQHGVLHP